MCSGWEGKGSQLLFSSAWYTVGAQLMFGPMTGVAVAQFQGMVAKEASPCGHIFGYLGIFEIQT